MCRVDLGLYTADRSLNVQMDLSAAAVVERHPDFLEGEMGGEARDDGPHYRVASHASPSRPFRT